MTIKVNYKFNKSSSPTKEELCNIYNLYNDDYEIFCNCIGNFFVSNFGNVKRQTYNGDFVDAWTNTTEKGYKYFKHKNKKYKIHQQVLKCFVGDRPDGLVCDHIDRNRLNNHITNLRYVTIKQNNINSSRYRTDIQEQDPVKRKAILNKLNYEKRKQKIFELKQKQPTIKQYFIVLT